MHPLLLILLPFPLSRQLAKQAINEFHSNDFVITIPPYQRCQQSFHQSGKEDVHRRSWGRCHHHGSNSYCHHPLCATTLLLNDRHDHHPVTWPTSLFSILYSSLCLHHLLIPMFF